MDNILTRATDSLGDVLDASLGTAFDRATENRRLLKAQSILSRMGTIYSVYSTQNAQHIKTPANEKECLV